MRNLNTPTHGDFGDALHRAGNGIKRVGGTVLAGAIISAIGLQAAPVDKAFAETQTKQDVTQTTQTRQQVDVNAKHTSVVDYADGYSGSTPSALKKHGVKIVVRYVGYKSGEYAWKNLTKGEATALRKEGIDIVSVYETTASWMRAGYQAGVSAAKTARADIVASGGPKKPFVYFACDEDADYTAQVNSTLRGAASVLGRENVGIYGGYTVVDSALKTRSAAKGWQTMAWSQGKVAKNISLYQTIKTYAGDLNLDYDSNFAHEDAIGQWSTRTVTTAPASKPATTPRTSAPLAASKPALTDSGIANLTALFLAGGRS